MYKQVKSFIEGIEPRAVQRITDDAAIPFDPANTDYQAYLKWLDAGNTPEAADEDNINQGSN